MTSSRCTNRAQRGVGICASVCCVYLCRSIIVCICDPLSENLALRANIEFELEAILSVQVVSQVNSDYWGEPERTPH